ncbi:hypothetical protein [Desulfurococcus sp.]|uniref:hypothetical protein n=1 Tax=Desulfurococcus sp. TaxID=51678 RepID=UPI00317DADED
MSGKPDLKTIKERVAWILEHYPNARNSDLYLIILYLRQFTELGKYIEYIPYELIKKYNDVTWTVRRMRQKIQEEGLYLPTDPSVLKRRRRLAKVMRRAIKKV